MAQHDGVIDNGPGLAVRTDINAALQALISQNSGPVEPTTKYPGQMWLDTTVVPNGLVRMRNQANTGWVTPTVLPETYGSIVMSLLVSSGTWTKPAGLRFLEVIVCGAGAGGAGVSATAAGATSGGAGGGGGSTAIKIYAASDLPASQAFTIGAGGSGGVPGSTVPLTGGSSLFMSMTGTGGTAPSGNATSATFFQIQNGGLSSAASGGTINLSGGYGGQGFAKAHGVDVGQGGERGGSFLAPTQPSNIVGPGATGPTGIFPGGGGGGASNTPSQAARPGGAGALGCIIIKEIF